VQDCGDYKNILDPNKLFERGFSTKEKEGRGLGLYSAKQIIEKHSGKIKIADYDGHTCFCFNVKK
jgi:sensor histidine kinase regulating citrate/malate metabolism